MIHSFYQIKDTFSVSFLFLETPAEKKFEARISVNGTYVSSYRNLSSNETVNFIRYFEAKMGDFFESRLSEFKRVNVTGLLNGSVVVEFDIVVGKSSNASVDNIKAALREGNSTGSLGYTLTGKIDIKEVQESSTVVVPTHTSETGNLAPPRKQGQRFLAR